MQVSGFCTGAGSCGQGSTWVAARILDLIPERGECCCLFFGTSVSRLPGFMLLQLRLNGLTTVLSAGPRVRLKSIKIQLKSTEKQMESIEISIKIYWMQIDIQWNPLKSIEIHWKSNEIYWHPFKIQLESTENQMNSHWNPWTSIEFQWTFNEIHWHPLKSIRNSMKSTGTHWNQMKFIEIHETNIIKMEI